MKNAYTSEQGQRIIDTLDKKGLLKLYEPIKQLDDLGILRPAEVEITLPPENDAHAWIGRKTKIGDFEFCYTIRLFGTSLESEIDKEIIWMKDAFPYVKGIDSNSVQVCYDRFAHLESAEAILFGHFGTYDGVLKDTDALKRLSPHEVVREMMRFMINQDSFSVPTYVSEDNHQGFVNGRLYTIFSEVLSQRRV